ncbi:MAG TPA: hypothetical protein VIE90_02225 [Candidatus Binatia bacterium]|jgi:hypothetical protein
MKFTLLTVTIAGLAVICSAKIAGEPQINPPNYLPRAAASANLRPKTLPDIAKMLIEQKQASWREHVRWHSQEWRDQRAAFEIMKKLYEKDLISKLEIENHERAAAGSHSGSERATRKGGPALSLVKASSVNKAKRATRGTRKHSQAQTGLIRYDGAASWTIDDIDKIDAFFRERFGRPLPISARGQSLIHDRLGLDHSDAVDVPVRPGSAEGRALMAYLRAAGVPFIAFRGRVSRMSTGPHIHIGPPSPRLMLVKRDAADAEKSDDRPEES